MAPGGGVPADMAVALVAKADGVGFFLEELVRAVRERGDFGGVAGIPATIQGVITTRLDCLPVVERELLEVAAVLGKEGAVSLLRETSGLSVPEFIRLDPVARRRVPARAPRRAGRGVRVRARPDPRGRLSEPRRGAAARAAWLGRRRHRADLPSNGFDHARGARRPSHGGGLGGAGHRPVAPPAAWRSSAPQMRKRSSTSAGRCP